MARRPEDRYPDTAALAKDLRAYLEHRVVAAHRTGAVAELRKWVERNPAFATTLAAGILSLIGGAALLYAMKKRSDENAARAHAEEIKALGAVERNEESIKYLKQVLAAKTGTLENPLPPPLILKRLDLLEDATRQLQRAIQGQEAKTPVDHALLYQQQMELASLLTAQGRSEEASALLQGNRPYEPVPDLRIMPREQLHYSLVRESRVTMGTAQKIIPLTLRYEQELRLTVAPAVADAGHLSGARPPLRGLDRYVHLARGDDSIRLGSAGKLSSAV
jgi:hypothetical protein